MENASLEMDVQFISDTFVKNIFQLFWAAIGVSSSIDTLILRSSVNAFAVHMWIQKVNKYICMHKHEGYSNGKKEIWGSVSLQQWLVMDVGCKTGEMA